MTWWSWCIVIIPFSFVLWMAFYCRRYIRGVADFLVAGRVAGRYVISVGGVESALGVVTLVAMVEVKYQSGYGIVFWNNILVPLSIIISLTGFCVYRFRETKALSMGQFLEMRYNRAFRVFASIIRSMGEMMTNTIGPAVAARFFIYLLGIPHTISLFGFKCQTFVIILMVVVLLALIVLWTGGQISLIVTDTIQGLISYPIFVIFTVFMLTHFSWFDEMCPALLDRVPGESLLNPYDIAALRDFNIFALVVAICAKILNTASWLGAASGGTARSAHEQKMASILGSWRAGFAYVMCLMIGAAMFVTMTHKNFADDAKKIRDELSTRVADEIIDHPEIRARVIHAVQQIPAQRHEIGIDPPLSLASNLDTSYFNTVAGEMVHGKTAYDRSDGYAKLLEFRSLYHQMMLPVSMRNILPPALLGLFCLLMVMLMVSTDDTRIFSSAIIITQDIILPFISKPLSPLAHLWLVRFVTLLVGALFFVGSFYLSQLDYIQLFTVIMSAIWLGGAGSVLVGGLYTRFGTTSGAFAALITGSAISIGGVLLQRNWPDHVYPWLVEMGWHDGVARFLEVVTTPFSPYVVWVMNPVKCPINSQEFYFMSMVFSVFTYVLVSLLTYRKPFNLEQMLHRGQYATEGDKPISSPWTWRNVYNKLIGITPEYTRSDRIIAWSVFFYSIVYGVILGFIGIVIWNSVAPWPPEWWGWYTLIKSILVPAAVGVVTTVWFFIGGIIDLKRMFRDLSKRMDDPLDDGRVDGNVSLSDKAAFEKLEKSR